MRLPVVAKGNTSLVYHWCWVHGSIYSTLPASCFVHQYHSYFVACFEAARYSVVDSNCVPGYRLGWVLLGTMLQSLCQAEVSEEISRVVEACLVALPVEP